MVGRRRRKRLQHVLPEPVGRGRVHGVASGVGRKRIHGVGKPGTGTNPVVTPIGADQHRVAVGAEVDRVAERCGERGDRRDPRHALDDARGEEQQRLLPVAVLTAAPDGAVCAHCDNHAGQRRRRRDQVCAGAEVWRTRIRDGGTVLRDVGHVCHPPTGVDLPALRPDRHHVGWRKRRARRCGGERLPAVPRHQRRARSGAHRDRVTYGRNARDGDAAQCDGIPPRVCRPRRSAAADEPEQRHAHRRGKCDRAPALRTHTAPGRCRTAMRCPPPHG